MSHPVQALVPTTLPQAVNGDDIIHVDYFDEKTPVVSSRDVARHFGKQHKNILQQIQEIKSVIDEDSFRLNFQPQAIPTPTGFGIRNYPAYLLTRDAFTLLVMGFTGAAAMRWKLKYIEAFNALERAVMENALELARQAGFEAARELLGPETETAAFENGVSAVLGLTDGQLAIAKAVRRYHKAGLSTKESARLLGVSPDQVRRTLRGLEVWS